MDEAVVGARPEEPAVERRRRERVDDAPLSLSRLLRVAVLADARRHVPARAREVGADRFPGAPAVRRLPDGVRREVEDARVDGREQDRLRAQHPVARGPQRARGDVLRLAGAPVVARELAAVDDVGVERVGRDVAVLLDRHRVPVAEGDPPVVRAARDTGRAALLLAAADAVRERVVRADVVELRRRLVVPAAPALAGVHRDDGPLVGREDHHLRPLGVDPDPLVVVPARRAAEAGERLPAVRRLPRHDRRDEHDVGILRVDSHLGGVRGPGDDAGIGVHARPGLARVVGAVDPRLLAGLDGGEEAAREARGHRHPDPPEALGERRQPLRERPPRLAAVRRLVEAAAGSRELAVLPRPLPCLPERRVDDVGILRIESHVRRAGVGIAIEDLKERVAAVRRLEDPALLVRSVGVAEHGDEQPVRVAGIDDDLRDLLPVAEAEVRPRPAAVPRAVDPVARREVGPLHPLAAADVDHVGVRRRDRDGPDRARRLVVEDRLPRAAVVGRLPDAAVDDADVEEPGPAGDAGRRLRAAGAERADAAPAHLAEEGGVERPLRGRGPRSEGEHDQGGGQQARRDAESAAGTVHPVIPPWGDG